MNGNYYPNPTFPGAPLNSPQGLTPNQQTAPYNKPYQNINSEVYEEQSYIENILRLNKGKVANVYASYPDSVEWRDRIFKGVIEQAGRDHLIISDPSTGTWYLILIIYINYVTFEEPINYNPSFASKGNW